ncbi:Retrovirus-related Pol polyprotein from transposon 17.6 [Trichinella patagoniensis]|uniref:Retrovirus-related Pol polyprotein from transposon 17.6 n=1 Tax=Trichinella patagoniensis TaxID=990121 RepID=A0A0V1AGJ3_9BILA|nr:Retrovirus-related Pol polyprotein from transposon 17.6 [Trichinella patagoniensis]
MPSGKREAERKGNPPVNTGSSPNSDGRANNTMEEANEPARGSGGWRGFFSASKVPPSDHGVVARYLLSDSVHRELYLAGQARENSVEEFKKRLPGQYAQEVAEVGRRAGVSKRDLLARGITSKQAYMAMRLHRVGNYTPATQRRRRPKRPVHRQLDTRNEENFPEAGKAGADGCATRRKKRRLLLIAVAWATSDATAPTKDAEPNDYQRARRAADLEPAGCCPWPDCKQTKRHVRRALGEGDGDDTACGWSTNVHQRSGGGAVATGPFEGRVPVIVVRNLVIPDVLGTNFFNSFVRTVDWQTQEITTMDGSKVRIEHDPTWAGQPSIGCAVVAKPQGVGIDAGAGADGPDDWTRARVDRAECSAQTDLGRTSCVQHRIETGGAQLMKLSPRRLPQAQREVVDQPFREMLHAGKKDGSPRFCVDHRRLNAVTRVDAQPIPPIDDTLDALAGVKWFSTLDLASGCWQVEVAESREKSAFSTPLRLFQFRVMPFGLCNALATFQRLMEKALRGLTGGAFGALGKGAVPPAVRGTADQASKVPTDATGTWATLVQIQRRRRRSRRGPHLSANFAGVANPLQALIKKGEKWRWCLKEKEAFVCLKHALVSFPILCHPHFDRTFLVDVDASEDAIGAVLSQQGEQGPSRVVAYASRLLSRAERSYCATRREMLALVWATHHFRPYLTFGSLRDRLPAGWKNKLSSTLRWSLVPGRGTRTRMRCLVALADSAGPVMTPQMSTWQLWRAGVDREGEMATTGSRWQSLDEEPMEPARQDSPAGEDCMSHVVAGHPEVEHPGNPYGHPQLTDGGHLGVAKTPAKMCAAHAIPTRKLQAPIQLQPVSQPFQRVPVNPLRRYGVARTVATALVNGVFCRYGAPETLHYDQSRNFESELVKEVCQLFDVTKTWATAYHPQSDGLVERMNRTLLDMLAKASIDHPEDWDVHLGGVLLAYRTMDLMYGVPTDAQHLRRDLERVYEVIRKKAGREQRRQKAWKDRKAYGPVYERGDQRKLDWNTYRVEKMGGGREQMVVHFDRLKPYHGTHQGEGAQRRQRERRETRTQKVSTGRALHEGESGVAHADRANNSISPENEAEES